MSVITDILLSTYPGDGDPNGDSDCHPNADILSAYLADRYGGSCALKRLDKFASGSKNMTVDLFGVCINYCDIEALLSEFTSIQWESPEAARLFVNHEDWDGFRIFCVGDQLDQQMMAEDR